MKKIRPFIDKDVIKVIIGQRRVGKSFLLFHIMDEIKKLHTQANIIYINKELHEFEETKNSNDLLDYIAKHSKPKRKNYVFIDEIQDIADFEKALRDLVTKKNYDLYCTGSNAFMLSSELASKLSGRYIECRMHSLSFLEFLQFHKLDANIQALTTYIKYGGLPYLINLDLTDDVVYDYLKNIYHTILLKDIVTRFRLRNVNFLNRLVDYLAHHTGVLFSAKKISDFLKSQKINISPNIVMNYVSYLIAACFIHQVSRSDVLGKKIFEINEKYYFEDLGLRHSLIGFRQADMGQIMENLVFNHLKFFGYTITVGKIGNQEIDFVCEKNNQKLYVQVAYVIDTAKTQEREFGSLLAVKDNYRKIVVSYDVLAKSNYEGIEHIGLLDFLTSTW